jgi:predicted ATPase/DNA-binding SARP family transcriptional activator/tetratricopeptide (TPR) repeat protein
VLTISVLGPVEVRLDGRFVTVPAGKTSEVLVRLALEAGIGVRADRLVDDLWGADAFVTRRNTLQSKIVKLRKALGDPSAVASVDGGYRLDIDPHEVDALLVADRLAEVTALVDRGDDEAAATLCTSTRLLFRGEVLIGAGDGGWVVPHRARLEAARLQLIETECAARLRLGQLGEVIGDLEAAVAAFPFQESLWELLITALYRAGRQADALGAYHRVHALLADELGLEPGPQLRRVEEQVLAQDTLLDVASTNRGPSPRKLPIGNLPTLLTDLVGRNAEVSTVTALVVAHSLVEIVGPGGIGKTALALAVAHASTAPGGVWLARLETTTTSDEVIDSVIAALGVTGGVGALHERLRSADTEVVLDNAEHVLDAVADLVQRLLDAAPGTRILCTTQAPLGIDGEVVIELEPLGLADSVELFTRRASAQRRQQTVGDVVDVVRDVCRSLDGLPLAIELAAARTKTLSIAEIGRRLDDRFELLHDPTSRRPERRRALRATIGWSYDLLFPDDQRGLWALAPFAGGASLPAIEHVLQALDVPPRTAIDVIGRLASRSLLIVDGDVGSTATRYRLLDSIRAFALEAMAESGITGAAHAAHAAWFAMVARGSTVGTRGEQQAEHLAVARAERSNIDAALNWCVRHDPLLAVTIANGFGWAWVVLGDSRGAQRILTALDAAGTTAPAGERATGLLLAGWLEASIGTLGPARRHIDEASALASSIGDLELQARSAYYLAYVVSHDGDFRTGMELTDRSRALYAGLDRPWDLAANSLFATRAAISAGDGPRALEAAADARVAITAVADPWLHVRYEAMLGELARLQHRFDEAVEHIGRAAATSRKLGFLQTEAYQVASLGRALCQAGNYELGATTLASAIAKAEATGDARMAALAKVHLGRVLRALGDSAGARTVLEQAAAWHRAEGGGEQAVLGECLLAALDAADGVAAAPERLSALLEQAVSENNAPAEVFALDALARITATAGDEASARSLSIRADARMAVASHFIAARDRVDATDAGVV